MRQSHLQAKLKEAEDETGELAAKLEAVLEEKRQLELRVAEFAQTLAERDELIAQLRAGKQVGARVRMRMKALHRPCNRSVCPGGAINSPAITMTCPTLVCSSAHNSQHTDVSMAAEAPLASELGSLA